MSNILLCSRPTKTDFLHQACAINANEIQGLSCSKPSTLAPYTPYVLGEKAHSIESQLLVGLAEPKVAKNLTDISLALGEDNTLVLAEVTQKLQEFNIGLIGNSTTLYGHQIEGFGKALKSYQEALMNYREAIKFNTEAKGLAKQQVLNAHQKLQITFKHEFNAITTRVKAKRGTPISNPQRAMNIAQSSRNVAKLEVTSNIQANNLIQFAKYTSYLGNGLALIDFSSRVGNIYNEYQVEGDWERELFVESLSFAASTYTASSIVTAGATLIMVATPTGWAIIVGGLLLTGTAAAASITMNNFLKKHGSQIYNYLMNRLGL